MRNFLKIFLKNLIKSLSSLPRFIISMIWEPILIYEIWNSVLPEACGVKPITLIQAMWLAVLVTMLRPAAASESSDDDDDEDDGEAKAIVHSRDQFPNRTLVGKRE